LDTLILYRKLPKIIYYQKWDYKEYNPYLEWRYGKKIKKNPVNEIVYRIFLSLPE